MPIDITKLDMSEANVNGQAGGETLSLVKAPDAQLQKADELIEQSSANKPTIFDRRARREFDRGRARLIRAKFETIEIQMRGLLEQCKIVTETANEATRIASETLLNRLCQAAAVQRTEVANAAYQRVLDLGIERFQIWIRREDAVPAELVERELKRCARELEMSLQAIDLRAAEPSAATQKAG